MSVRPRRDVVGHFGVRPQAIYALLTQFSQDTAFHRKKFPKLVIFRAIFAPPRWGFGIADFFGVPPPGASILQGLGPQALPEGAGYVDTNQTVGPSTSLKASWQPWWRVRGAHKPRASERAFRAWRPGPSRMVSDQSESERPEAHSIDLLD